MIVHLLKIIRAQFRSNLWILAELMVVFVALWIMTDYFITQYTLYHRPVGFETDRVYQAVVFFTFVRFSSVYRLSGR